MKKSILYIALFFILQAFAYAVALVGNQIQHGSSDLTVGWMIVMQAVFSLLCIALFAWRRWTPVDTYTPRTSPRSQIYLWTIVAALGTIVPSMWLQEWLSFLPDYTGKELTDIIFHPLGYLVIAVLAPVAEEVVFRGGILRTLLTDRRPWVAIAVSALFFAVAHFNPAQMPHALLLGLLLGWIFWRTGSILPGIVLHLVNNTVAFVMARAYPHMDDLTLQQLLGGSQRQVVLALLFSLCLLLPALFQLNERMRRPKY